MVEISIKRLDPELPLPSYAHPGDAGADLHSAVDLTLDPGERALVPTGIALALPEGYVALVHPRSGLAAKHGISIVNAPGHHRRGLPRRGQGVPGQHRPATEPFAVRRGDRIAQLVIQRFETAAFVEADELPESARGEGGYGSTGGFVQVRQQPEEIASGGDGTVRFGRKARDEEPSDGPSRPRGDDDARGGIGAGSDADRPVRRRRRRGPRRARVHRPRQPAGHAGRADGDAAAGRRGERRGDGGHAGRRAGRPRAARVRGGPRWRLLGRAAAADLGRDGPDGRHRDRGGRHLRDRAGLRGPDADARRPAGLAGEPDQRPRGAQLAAAGHADGPAGRRAESRRAPGRRRSGRSSYDVGARRWRPVLRCG